MGVVSDQIRSLVSRQVEESGLVVWFDPEEDYGDVPATLDKDIQVEALDGSFFELRRRIDRLNLMRRETPPRLVVYVPCERGETHYALAELVAAGVELFPGAASRPRNTRLSTIARRTLETVLGVEGAAAVEKQVADGKLTLGELDRLAEQGKGASGTVSLVFGTTNPADVALAFLASDQHDATLVEKDAVPELAGLLGGALDTDLTVATGPADLRERLARHVLLSDLVDAVGAAAPSSLTALPHAQKTSGQESCRLLAQTWRLRRDLQESYAEQANRVERSLALGDTALPLKALEHTETFSVLEQQLQEAVETALSLSATTDLVELAHSRQSSFWSGVSPTIQARWALIATAGRVLLEADRVATALKSPALSANQIFSAYTEGDTPWCLLDTGQRHLERRVQAFDFAPGAYAGLDSLVVRARQRYMDIGSTLAERFVRAFSSSGFKLTGVSRQREVFKSSVAEPLGEGKTAYVLVDAMRFEMARELVQGLGDGFSASISSSLGSLPSITEVGMAALLPNADLGAKLVKVADGKLGLEIDGAVLRDRKDRISFLQSHVKAQVFDCKLGDLLPPRKATQTAIQQADLVLVTSQEIDALCEGDNVPLARRHMDDVLWELRRAFRVLINLGVESIIVSADHGYLFGDALDVDMKIDAPGGQTADLHRRVWVGVGGAASDSYLRLRASDMGLDGDFDVAVPWNFACFKAGGASAFFHGGLSPQEIAIPVAVIRGTTQAAAEGAKKIEWTLRPGSKKISTRFFSVQVAGTLAGLFDEAAPRVRVEVRAKTRQLSTPVTASYGFDDATGDVQLRPAEGEDREIEPNTVTLMLGDSVAETSASVYLIEANTGRELARIGPIDVAIAL